MVESALALDKLKRIVNVHWDAGAIFVVKNINCELFLGKISSASKVEWSKPSLAWEIFSGFNAGSSSAEIGEGQTKQTVFVVGAQKENEEGDNGAVLLVSNDGKNWTLAFERYEVGGETFNSPWIVEPTGIVWDETEKKFFASFYEADIEFQVDDFGLTTVVFYDGETIYSSSDGESWGQVTRTVEVRPGGEGITDDDTSALKQYCKKEENRGQVPDGLQAYNKDTKIFMKPQALRGFSPVNGALYDGEGSTTITIESLDAEGAPVTGSATASEFVFAVGQFNSIWVATGGTDEHMIIDVSTDNGKLFTNVYQQAGGDWGNTVSGGRTQK